MGLPDGYEENETDRCAPPLHSKWKEMAIEFGETEWPELLIHEDEPFPDITHFRVLKGRYHDPDDEFGSRAFDWPPLDVNDTPYPLDFFDYTDLDDNGKLVDEESNSLYSVFNGNLSEKEYGCNAPLDGWRWKFPEKRYCGISIRSDDEYCKSHKGRANEGTHILDNMDAEEMVQTGFFAQTVDHTYEGIDPYKRVFAWGLFSSLMGESVKEFAPEEDIRYIDFSNSTEIPDEADEEDGVEVTVKYPTQYLDAALALFNAAVDAVKMLNVQPRLLDEDNGGVMSTKSTSHAQLTAPPSEHDPSPEEWKTIDEITEHPLNLPYARLVKDRERLLKRGGVIVDPSEDDDNTDEDIEVTLDVTADPEVDDKHEKFGDNENGVTKDIAANVDGEHDFETE